MLGTNVHPQPTANVCRSHSEAHRRAEITCRPTLLWRVLREVCVGEKAACFVREERKPLIPSHLLRSY
ncbi:hypothetical protein Q8A73_006395 [Channa argus]|nr:hypothetical protein Q8A73_006395 [Channa argus]